MDGTLLQNGVEEVSEEALKYIETLFDMGIIVVSASGRQYANQRRLYKHLAKRMPMICENGSITVYQEKIWKTKMMSLEEGRKIYDAFSQEEGDLLISGKDCCYVFDNNPRFEKLIRDILQNEMKVIHSFDEIKEPIGKFSIMTKDAQRLYEKYLPLWQDELQVAKSHPRWLDINSKEANKGNALRELMEELNITKDEVIAFGDNYNDIDMLRSVGFPIAMENGIDEVKEIAIARTRRVEDSLRSLIEGLR